jgi:hypothetical protein
MSFFKSILGQVFYWLALRFQVVHPIGGDNLLRADQLTTWQLRKLRLNASFMATSNRLTFGNVEREKAWERYENRVSIALLGVSHNPDRKLHPDSVL